MQTSLLTLLPWHRATSLRGVSFLLSLRGWPFAFPAQPRALKPWGLSRPIEWGIKERHRYLSPPTSWSHAPNADVTCSPLSFIHSIPICQTEIMYPGMCSARWERCYEREKYGSCFLSVPPLGRKWQLTWVLLPKLHLRLSGEAFLWAWHVDHNLVYFIYFKVCICVKVGMYP